MTELIWDGKYKDGKKTAPVRINLPFQTIETINESAADRQKRLGSLFNQKQNAGEWRNRLIWGDKKYVLPSLLAEFAGKINLIYIDPPFNVGSDFSFTATIPDHPDSEDDEITTFIKQPSIIEQKAYRDTWGRGLDSYLQWFYETVVLLRELLAENGSIYVHLDWHVCHYAKTILDEIFGYESFRNEIIWKRKTGTANSKNVFGIQTESIFFYTKTDNYKYERQYRREGILPEEINEKFNQIDEAGRRYWSGDLGSPNPRPNLTYEYKGYKPPKNGWSINIEIMKSWDKEGKLIFPKDITGRIRRKMFLDDWLGFEIQNLWDDISPVQPQSKERVEYKTQKPEKLIDRILTTSSSEGDLVLDCFCGSGTTAAVAEKLNRRWITCDLGRFAIHTTRKRLLGIPEVKPFVVQNLGKYERQQWVQAEFENPADRLEQERAYKKFICELYHAKALEGYTWLHGAKAGRMIHVGSVEAPVTVEDVKASILEFWKLIGKEKSAETNGIDFLGWDFAFEVNETAAQFAKSNKVDVKFKKIPREVLEKKAVDQGDIKFYELASLKVKTKTAKQQLTVSLENFIIPPDDVPEEVRASITHWSQWIDYWSIDWNYKDDTFHNEWQSYRTKQNPKIDLTAFNHYEEKGKYTLLVKVIDILGNDTTKAITIEIA
jgi:adenine specific DNA methylase Mod